jgi:hypothetical protein
MILVDLVRGVVVVILALDVERLFIVDSDGTVTIAERTHIEALVLDFGGDDDDFIDCLAYATDSNYALAA